MKPKEIYAKYKYDIIAKVRQGMLLREIAEQYGTDKRRIHYYVRNEPMYRKAIIAQSIQLIGKARQALHMSASREDFKRARKLMRMYLRYAEYVDPDHFGQPDRLRCKHYSRWGLP